MADKTKSIKRSTDKELDEILFRLRKENEVQDLIGPLKRKSTEEPIDSLYHFGVPGMKWGVRKDRETTGRRGSRKTSGSEDYQSSRAMRAKGSKNLSTKELKDLTQRLQLEKQLKDLSPSDYKRGMDVVKSITAAGTTLASLYALSKTPLAQDVIKAIRKKV